MERLRDVRFIGVLLACVILASMFAGLPQTAHAATTIYVPDNYPTIQAAVDAASPGDTIIVRAGTYIENVQLSKSITLKGEGMPVVDAGGNGSAIMITASGCTIEGFEVTNCGATWFEDAGIRVQSANNTVRNNAARNNFCHGIYLFNANGNVISNNTVRNNGQGIYLRNSGDNTLRENDVDNNNMAGTTFNFGVDDIGVSQLSHYINDIDTSNTVDGKPIYYLVNEENKVINYISTAGYVGVVNSTNIVVSDLTLGGNGQGVLLAYSQGCTVKNIRATDNDYGIALIYSDNNVVVNNYLADNSMGIRLEHSNGNTLNSNDLPHTWNTGIGMLHSSENSLIQNRVSDATYGIELGNSSNNALTNNNVSSITDIAIFFSVSNANKIISNNISNSSRGIRLQNSNNNIIYFNDLINNTANVWGTGSTTGWNSPEEITYTYNGKTYTRCPGNYWSDYTGSDADGDGIGDSPYPIDSDRDNYPLMEPFENYGIRVPASDIKILFDMAHNLSFSYFQTTLIDKLRACGYSVDVRGSGSITSDLLNDYNILVLINPTENFANSEKQAIYDFVEYGGGLLLASEYYGGWTDETWSVPNSLAEHFGVTFNRDAICAGECIINNFASHPTTQDIYSIGYYGGCTLQPTGPWVATAIDGGVVAQAIKFGLGKAFFMGDGNLFSERVDMGDYWIEQYDNERFALNIMYWLSDSTPDWRSDIKPGDILYDRISTFKSIVFPEVLVGIGHTGIYVGCGKTIEADSDQGVHDDNISSWDNPERKNVYLLRVDCPQGIIDNAIEFAKNQANKDYEPLYWLISTKRCSPNSSHWYCNELIWAAYYNQGAGINIEYNPSNSEIPEGVALPGCVFLDPVTASDIYDDVDTLEIGKHEEDEPFPGVFVAVFCPVDLVVTDPQGLTISKNSNQILGAIYMQDDFNDDGSLDDLIYIPEGKKGVYLIQVIPEPDASPNDTFSLEVSINGQSIILANNVQVKDIPREPYRVQVTESGQAFVITGPPSLPPPVPRVSPSPPQPAQLPPADIRVHNISVSPGQAKTEQPVTVLANVVNNGASSGSYNVALRMVEVSPGAAYPVKFTVTKSQPGTYDVAIEGQKASFTVLGGSASQTSASGGLIALIVMVMLILATAVVLMISFRRPA